MSGMLHCNKFILGPALDGCLTRPRDLPTNGVTCCAKSAVVRVLVCSGQGNPAGCWLQGLGCADSGSVKPWARRNCSNAGFQASGWPAKLPWPSALKGGRETNDARPPAFLLERAAARYFGIRTRAVHVNGLVDTGSGAAMWIARRSPAKAIDPGMLDNLVGGGIAAGATVAGTLVKEAWEEAGIDAALASQARPSGTVQVRRMQPDGLQHETIHVHDLWLPRSFVPANQDGEAVEHRLVPLSGVPALLARSEPPDALTADASLVALSALIRLGAIDADAPLYPWLAELCDLGR